ncbi:MAG: hypothetical protein LKJ86_00725 [Oscillibacter sp.]|jgi:ABC-2 type transport system permease protein|nr:hypothetical protein [Oscillibacter sp.]
MQSKTSSFKGGIVNRALLRKNLTRFWPLWAVYAAAWLVMLPLTQFLMLFGTSGHYETPAELKADAANMVLSMASDPAIIMAVLFGCLAAMALCAYLCSARSVGMMHAFPIRREEMYLTNFLSGAVAFAATNVVVFLLTAAIQAAGGVLIWKNLLLWLGCSLGTLLFFYGFAFFCAMFTGQILAIPAFYGILNVLAVGLNDLIQSFAGVFFYGYTGGGTPGWVIWLTPVWKLVNDLQVNSTWYQELGYSDHYSLGNPRCVLIYAAFGVIWAILGLLVYRVRRSETASDTVTVRWAKPLFRYGVAVCAALSLGQGLYFLVWQAFRTDGTYSLPGILVCMILTGLVGYYAAEMLLRKSFRVFRKSRKGAAILVAALVLFGVGVSLDVTGVEHKVPATANVESLEFSIGGQNYCSGEITDPDVIESFRAAHQAMLDEKAENLNRRQEDASAAHGNSGYSYAYVTLNYHLKRGGTVSRNYSLYYTADDQNVPGSSAALLAELSCNPAVQRANLFNGKDYAGKMTAGEMYYQIGNGNQDSTTFDGETAEILYAAILKDIDAGHFGKNQFKDGAWEKETYVNSLSLYYSTQNDEMDGFSVDFSTNCTYLLAALKETGVVNEDHPLTTYAENNEESLYGEQSDEPSTETAIEKRQAEKNDAVVAEETGISTEIIGGADGPTAVFIA